MNNHLIRIGVILFIACSFMLTTSCNNGATANLKNKNKSTMEKTHSKHITLINSFEGPTGKVAESIKYWEDCRDFLKIQPGYISTKLHKSIKEGSKFELINVAVWESPKAFTEASQKMAKELGVSPTEGLKANPSLYTVISE